MGRAAGGGAPSLCRRVIFTTYPFPSEKSFHWLSEPLSRTRPAVASVALCCRSWLWVQTFGAGGPGATDDRPASPASPRRGEAEPGWQGVASAPHALATPFGASWEVLDFRVWLARVYRALSPCLLFGQWPFKLCFLNFGGVVVVPPPSSWLFPDCPVVPSAQPFRCFGVMSREGAGTCLMAEVIKGECEGYRAGLSRAPRGTHRI